MKPCFQTLPLPDIAHVPGVNPRPDLSFLESIAAYALPVSEEHDWASNLPWLYGLELFNNGFYWEAHEVWETVWMNARPNSCEKRFVQGVIHFANGLLKIRMARPKAAARLFDLAASCIEQAVERQDKDRFLNFMGLDLVVLNQNLLVARSASVETLSKIQLKYVL